MLKSLNIGAATRWAPWLVLALIYAWLVPTVAFYLLFNNLLKGDGAGHLFLIEFAALEVLPFTSHWCHRVWGGFSAGHLYPPLFHYLAAMFSLLLGPLFSAKALASLVWLATPVAGLLTARKLTKDPLEQGAVLAALMLGLNLPSSVLGTGLALGANMQSAMENGMLPSSLGALTFLLYLWSILPSVSGDSHDRKPPLACALPAMLLGATVLSHAVWGLVAAICTVVVATRDCVAASPGKRRAVFTRWGLIVGLGFAVSGVFSIPFLVHRALVSPIFLPSHWSWAIWLPFAAMAMLALLYRRNLAPSVTTVSVCALAVVLPVPLAEAAEIPFHLFRLTIPAAMLCLPVLALLLQRAIPRVGGWVGIVLTVGGLVATVPAAHIHPKGNPGMDPPQLDGLAGHGESVMVLSKDGHTPGYHALPYLTATAGPAGVSHGISVESAAHGLITFRMLSKLDPEVFVWGVNTAQTASLSMLDPAGQFTDAQMDALHLSHILTDRRLRLSPRWKRSAKPVATFRNHFWTTPEAVHRLRTDHFVSRDGRQLEFYLYSSTSSSLVRSDRRFVGVPQELFPKAQYAWFASGAGEPVPAVVPLGEYEHCADVSISDAALLPGPEVAFEVLGGQSSTSCPIWVKSAWHPHWELQGEAGQGPFRAGAGMLVLARPGAVRLTFKRGACDFLGIAATLAGLLACALLLVVTRRKEH